MKATRCDWQRTIWKLVKTPGAELVVTLALVILATWFVLQEASVLQGAGLPIFGHR